MGMNMYGINLSKREEENLNDEFAKVIGNALDVGDSSVLNAITPDEIPDLTESSLVLRTDRGWKHADRARELGIRSRLKNGDGNPPRPDFLIEDPNRELFLVLEHKLGSSFTDNDRYEEMRQELTELCPSYTIHLAWVSDTYESTSVPHVRYRQVYSSLEAAETESEGLNQHLMSCLEGLGFDKESSQLPNAEVRSEFKKFMEFAYESVEQDLNDEFDSLDTNIKGSGGSRLSRWRMWITGNGKPRVNNVLSDLGSMESSQLADHYDSAVYEVIVRKESDQDIDDMASRLSEDWEETDSQKRPYARAFVLEGQTTAEVKSSFLYQLDEIVEANIKALSILQDHPEFSLTS